MGLGTVIQQFASHEWSQLSFDQAGRVIGNQDALSRLISLARAAAKWYAIAGIIMGFGLCIGGYIFFDNNNALILFITFSTADPSLSILKKPKFDLPLFTLNSPDLN